MVLTVQCPLYMIHNPHLCTGNKCGPQIITGWTVNLDQKMLYADTAFSAGTQVENSETQKTVK